ncbi:putative mixed-linked glucan synthase 6 [Dichanthelium oligosanthes]|uniref:Putative mixed-linked glucan synthase 6 n=1 Tax=Dichanthelium oligosanthes TaxID=888268 RepID=A0A1E5W288_9POAL|nr:putative mixed-linked glucan synthase 6 [Dichanthelium oligosanthes]
MAPGGGDGRRNGEAQANGKHGCACGFPVCACAGAAAVASAASSADMDRVAVAATEGQIGAVNDESWVAVDLSDDLSGDGADDGVAIEDRPVFRTEKIKGILLHPYRVLIFVRLIAFTLFVIWRISHRNPDAQWLWVTSIAGEFWFGFSWLLDQLPKLNPINRVPDLAVLRQRFDRVDGTSRLPGLDIFVTTADPFKEPILSTANSILSILAADYPVERNTCYLSDDSGMLLTYEAMVEAAKFATVWVPFCRKHGIEPRGPESYFELKSHPYMGRSQEDFVNDRRRVRKEYDEFKARINGLEHDIKQRSDAYNAARGLKDGEPRATWMADGSQWEGTWVEPSENHRKGDHAGIVLMLVNHPSHTRQLGPPASADNPLDFSMVDVRLPMLVYVAREKRPGFNHEKKAGAMNALTRCSAVLTNSPFILNLDCDHYINNSQALRAGICFMLGRDSDTVAFVQFPQRFEGVDPTDLYANHNRIFFDGTLRALDGMQGPIYVGTGCLFRRITLYGFDPPRINVGGPCFPALGGMFAKTKYEKPGLEMTTKAAVAKGKHGFLPLPKKSYGKSDAFVDSIPRASHPSPYAEAEAVVATDEATITEAVAVTTAAYEKKTGWGSSIGWVYGTVTEDVVTGYRMHIKGWRSRYCSIYPHAFIGTAPINLTERLYQVLRWSTGSLEIFFSKNNPLFGSTFLHPLQRVAYINITTYPFTALFLIFYTTVPALSFVTGHFIVQRPTTMFYVYLAIVLGTLLILAVLEVKWAGVTVFEWFRNGQFWMTASCSAYLAAVCQVLVKVVFRRDISFKLTSKQPSGDEKKDPYADLYVVRWTWLMVTPIIIILVNIIGSAVAFAKVLDGEWTHWLKVAGGVFFNFWVLFHLYPFAKGILGKHGKTPVVVLVWWAFTFVITAVLYINIPHIHGPGGGKHGGVLGKHAAHRGHHGGGEAYGWP